MSRGRPPASWLRQVDSYLKDMDMTGLASSWPAYPEGYGHGGPGVCPDDGQTEAYLKDMGMTDLATAWAMARRRSV